ncbi:hypothetical protein DB30_05478 [Enhygromyxa salina]|uniref:Lipoprotein n=1 Tax=Enhygromyxa salina TaxID=215803 RepID=A0A0C1ZD33_9BACT|nr:hypothetical protein [Enhygromyxa salina]KIG15604.1 hypothetical protein DB30_05478 [Enhygromyxa salina]
MRRTTILATTLALFTLAACDRSEPAPRSTSKATPGPPPELLELADGSWNNQTLTLSAGLVGSEAGPEYPPTLRVYPENGALHMVGSTWPEGTTVELLGTTLTAERDGQIVDEVPMRSGLGSVEIVRSPSHEDELDVVSRVDTGLELSVEVPKYKPRTYELPPINTGGLLREILLGARSGPVELGDEPPGADELDLAIFPRSLSMVLIVCPSCEPDTVKTYADIDWVVFADHERSGKTRKCSYIGGPVDVPIGQSQVRIYDRRTGELVAEKTFRARSHCPKQVLVDSSRTLGLDVDIPSMVDWVGKELTKQAKARAKAKPAETR